MDAPRTPPTHWNPWDNRPRFNDAAQQEHLKAWLAKALDLLERAAAGHALSAPEFAIAAPIASSLLVRAAALVLRNSPDLRGLERPFRFTEADPAFAHGVALGGYEDGGTIRTVVLASRDDFDAPPRASDPLVAERVFLDGLAPPPACSLTIGRFAAIHLGLSRLLDTAAAHIEPLGAIMAAHRPHPVTERARTLLLHARAHGTASDADWDTLKPPPEDVLVITVLPPEPRAFKRCRICKRALGTEFFVHTFFDRVARVRRGDKYFETVKRLRPLHEVCLQRAQLDDELRKVIPVSLPGHGGPYRTTLHAGRLRLMLGTEVVARWEGVTLENVDVVMRQARAAVGRGVA